MELLLHLGSEQVRLCLEDNAYKPIISLTMGDITIAAELTDPDIEILMSSLEHPDIEELEDQVEDLEETISLLDKQISSMAAEKLEVDKKLEAAEKDIEELEALLGK